MIPPEKEEDRNCNDIVPTTEIAFPGEGLLGKLVEEMAAFQRQGKCLRVEDLLARHSELQSRLDVVLRLIIEEKNQRQQAGEKVNIQEYFNRFPQWQGELQALWDRQFFLPKDKPQVSPPPGPLPTLHDLHFLTVLGQGGMGQVFLATQPNLADRPVVIKITPCRGQEHVTLARLQHTHIVPLYWVQDVPEKNERILCMPFFGSVTLEGLLKEMKDIPAEQRQGQQILDVLQKAGAQIPVPPQPGGSFRKHLVHDSYTQAVCRMGICLADALQYAHERGLIHLDVKPSNILLTPEGEPMLLDFHLAREPVAREGPRPSGLGGTLNYMSPEQKKVLKNLLRDQRVPTEIDCRSDIYSLGLVLYQSLGGPVPLPKSGTPRLEQCNAQVSLGLADIIHKCLAGNPSERYQEAGALAEDLRRHLEDRPLREVANRSWRERWRKWRRRRPFALPLISIFAAFVLTAVWGGWTLTLRLFERRQNAETALMEGEAFIRLGQYERANLILKKGLEWAKGLAESQTLTDALEGRVRLARRAQKAQELQDLANHLRFYSFQDYLPRRVSHLLKAGVRRLWEERSLLIKSEETDLERQMMDRIQNDLLDLVILWSELQVRLADPDRRGKAYAAAWDLLGEVENLYGPNHVILREQLHYAQKLGLEKVIPDLEKRLSAKKPESSWDHYSLGRILLQAGDISGAARELEKALALKPQDFVSHFYNGVCAYRQGRNAEALREFSYCIGSSPKTEEIYLFRSKVHAAMGLTVEALNDCNLALEKDSTLGMAYLQRGILLEGQKRYSEALKDFQIALKWEADPVSTYYHQARVHFSQKNWKAAQGSLQQVLLLAPGHKDALTLLKQQPEDR